MVNVSKPSIWTPLQSQVYRGQDAMIQNAWDAGVRFYDTAPMYGHGLSELRTGQSLRWKNRDDFVLSSKVGRILKPKKRSEIGTLGSGPLSAPFEEPESDGTLAPKGNVRPIRSAVMNSVRLRKVCIQEALPVFLTNENSEPNGLANTLVLSRK